MSEMHRRTVGDTTYCLGTAGSFIRVCPVCGHERFRGEPDNPLEYCWDGHGPLEVLTTDNLERYKALWARVDPEPQPCRGTKMTEQQRELLVYLSTRKRVVPVQPEKRPDLHALHDLGFVATHGDFACITDEGIAVLEQGAQSDG